MIVQLATPLSADCACKNGRRRVSTVLCVFTSNELDFAIPRYEGAEYSGGEEEPMDDYDEPQVCTTLTLSYS